MILIISCLWALFKSRFLIIFRISSVGKFIVNRDLHDSLCQTFTLFLSIEHWSGKKLLEIFSFSSKWVTNSSWCSSGGMQEMFLLFRRVFNIDQYDFWLPLGSSNLWDKRALHWFLDSSIKEFNFFWRNWNWFKNYKDWSLQM